MKTRAMKGWLISALLCLSLPTQAEDIDLFVGVPPDAADDLPNVLFVVDNTANWGNGNTPQPFTNLKAALSSTFAGLPTDKFRVGIMMFNETGNPNSNVSGGYVRAAIRTMNSTNSATYAAMINSLDPTNDKGNGAIGSLVMAEAWYYFTGKNAYAGTEKEKADYNGNTRSNLSAASRAVYALPGNALNNFKADPKYNSPLAANSCARNFIIYISNGASTDNNSVIKESSRRLALEPGSDTRTIPLSPAGLQDNPIDEWVRYMSDSTLDITTYTIDINPASTGQGPAWSAVLQSMADVSGGKRFEVQSNNGGAPAADDIKKAIETALSEIQSVNSVYASVSLPVSVNTQGTYLNQVFVGMFRPAQNALPRWDGNLKQYRLGYPAGSTQLETLDAAGASAINSSTGFIAECARSYWTPSTADTYWTNIEDQQCLPAETAGISAASNTPDGNMVEKGGQGYKSRGTNPANRNVYVEDITASTTDDDLTPLTSTSLSAAAVGAANNTERNLILDWIRGFNNRASDDTDLDSFISSLTAMRPSVHADVVHSRPVAINFGTDTQPDVTVFYGTNDGLLRAVDGDRNGGEERWAFLPREFYPHIKRLRDNAQQIYYPGLQIEEEGNRKNYGFDGPIVAYQAKDTPTDPTLGTAWIFASMRRGGESIYAFDVIDPESPVLKWRKGCFNGTCDTGLGDLGQTWAAPTIVKAAGYESGQSPLLLVSGGYDPCEDAFPHTCSASNKGNAVYVMDADTGAVLKSFETTRGVVADITPVTNGNGMLMYAYTADMGGNVYRLSGQNGAPINDTLPANWVLTQIASLGCDTATSTCNNRNRKFLYAPDVVLKNNTYYLLLGSGDREKPLGDASEVDNYFFMVQDRPTEPTWLTSENANCGVNRLCLNSLTPIASEADPSAEALASTKGWYLYLNEGEQVVTSAITVFGITTFSTNQPTPAEPGECTNNLGTARVYNVSYENAAAANDTRSAQIPGGGLPPSPVAGMVQLDDGTTVPFIIGGDADSPLAGREPETPGTTAVPKSRIYWNLEE
ncbi:pilus assembly protein [Halopseudomonas aestusnigri]|uniref:Type IV pilus assembly protein PilY1 n=1 Tax=Halopseudomonas aestusnigri TaxID=857252 RepID=A0AAQ1JRH2_9GAMM|nr:PilC/PilY family type IV pilus protein [Halopseudomonas aestusnigri]OWL84564.1 hypothetical protein B7O88_16065 [Halopseudomonas aestusnigri]SEG70577.1 type IV pilus assembly protein PilY1 [Halopseudomonas aestusnigri]